ncbi:AraC family transcriptional regulator [Undibacterium sp. YM2]|uniref:helix-turn-helix transcriptional regulator n=1 Tax=Undibacterium sp. YM2 TaxID=2058625 RepID=UPI001331C73D|nr:helix-turn-helix transcriptional regulator [Undibacterium sp. YM2]BBB69469.1 AraC family transcriptional regulator [Undibacterium sp. YM2]
MKLPQQPGRLFLWRGAALVISPGIDSSLHTHFALQLTYGLERPFRARLQADHDWTETRSASFAPHDAHQIDSDGGMLAHLFLEMPEAVKLSGTDLRAAFGTWPEFQALATSLSDNRHQSLDMEAAQHIRQIWQACALPQSQTSASLDSRILTALDAIAASHGADCNGENLARLVHLSESRFTHLFRQQTGMSLSRYLLWSRMVDAVAAVAQGNNMTAAAHASGFADLAHMSRTFRSMMGVAPSELHRMAIAFKQDAI